MSDPINHNRRAFLGAAGIGLAASFMRFPLVSSGKAETRLPDGSDPERFGARVASSGTMPPLADEGPLPELSGAVGWLNSPPLTPAALRGKVVLVDIWTYSCINSLRQLPYLKAWAAKYKDAGLVVIGVHTPEFAFEKDRANVEMAVRDYKTAYPIAIDSNHGIWRAFNNQYWPADYFVDGKGRIRHHHFGEGDYDDSERVIQQLLKENGATNFNATTVSISGDGIEAPPDNQNARSPETYVGYHRAEHFASPDGFAQDERKVYSAPVGPSLNAWGLIGAWTVGAESAVPDEASGRILFRFHSRDVHMVLGPMKNGKPVRFRVMLDGAAPMNDAGVDVAQDGSGEIRVHRLYQLVRQKSPVDDRTFEIEFLDAGAQAYVFTFG